MRASSSAFTARRTDRRGVPGPRQLSLPALLFHLSPSSYRASGLLRIIWGYDNTWTSTCEARPARTSHRHRRPSAPLRVPRGQPGRRGVDLPGLKKSGDITLKSGLTTDREPWNRRKAVPEGTVARRTGHIVFKDEAGEPALRWGFTNARPQQCPAPSLSGIATEVAVEEPVLAVDGFEQVPA
ncbi:phage tail protein [Kitasatospora phosalacinea]|uniref:phage tail protein n=1 Tax=Kitasatospora phosalacinea TaxID=2065 RepID=UPI0035DECEF8